MKRQYLLLIVLLLLHGCAGEVVKTATPQTTISALNRLLLDEQVTDARFQMVAGMEFLRINLPLRYHIRQYDGMKGLPEKKRFVEEFLKQAAAAGDRAMALYLTRVPAEKLAAFRAGHPEIANGAGADGTVIGYYRQQAGKALVSELARIRSMQTEAELDRYWTDFVGGIEESIMTKDRLTRELETFYAVPFVRMWIAYHETTDHRGPVTADFTAGETYTPLLTENSPSEITREDWKLLQDYAPVIVHEMDPHAAYPPEDDRFGEVSLEGKTLEEATPVVDTGRPVVYSYVDEKVIQGNSVKQLVYTFFHPAHPPLSKLDPEAGILDGWTVRVSLDTADRPLVFESVSNCGCYYKIFPSTALEDLGHQAFPEKLGDKQFYVENVVAGKYDAVVPELVTGMDGNAPGNIVLYFSAGHHQLMTIRAKPQAELTAQGFTEKTYDLRPYDELETLPFNGYRASLFDTDGLVRKADRPECKLLMPSGLYHAGHPRQRETQLIYFDESQLDDPGLLETYLRLPPHAFGQAE